MTIEDHIILGENVIESDTLDITVRAPAIYSWGRSDTNTLLQSPNDTPTANGIQALTFANKRTIIQVIKVQHLSCLILHDRCTFHLPNQLSQ